MGVSDDGNDPVALTQTRCPCPRVQGSDYDFVTLVVPSGAGVETQFDVVGVCARERASPVNLLKRVKGSRTKRLLRAKPKGADRVYGAGSATQLRL